MNVQQWNVKMKKVVPSEGKVLYDGEDLVNEVFMPNDADESKWSEVSQEEAEEIKLRKNPPTVYKIKNKVLNELDYHDKSEIVNSFYLNNEVAWLPKADRVGLQNSLTIEKSAGKEESTMWFNGVCYTINIDKALQMLSQIELYALKCYNVTERHKAEINKLEEIEEIEAYDYRIGYPEKLRFEL